MAVARAEIVVQRRIGYDSTVVRPRRPSCVPAAFPCPRQRGRAGEDARLKASTSASRAVTTSSIPLRGHEDAASPPPGPSRQSPILVLVFIVPRRVGIGTGRGEQQRAVAQERAGRLTRSRSRQAVGRRSPTDRRPSEVRIFLPSLAGLATVTTSRDPSGRDPAREARESEVGVESKLSVIA